MSFLEPHIFRAAAAAMRLVTIDGKFAGIALISHPENFRPCWWHARDYGFLGANPFGRAAFGAGSPSKVVVAPGTSLRLRFGILVHTNATVEELDLSAAYDDYLAASRDEIK